jgi:hypothetical protein
MTLLLSLPIDILSDGIGKYFTFIDIINFSNVSKRCYYIVRNASHNHLYDVYKLGISLYRDDKLFCFRNAMRDEQIELAEVLYAKHGILKDDLAILAGKIQNKYLIEKYRLEHGDTLTALLKGYAWGGHIKALKRVPTSRKKNAKNSICYGLMFCEDMNKIREIKAYFNIKFTHETVICGNIQLIKEFENEIFANLVDTGWYLFAAAVASNNPDVIAYIESKYPHKQDHTEEELDKINYSNHDVWLCEVCRVNRVCAEYATTTGNLELFRKYFDRIPANMLNPGLLKSVVSECFRNGTVHIAEYIFNKTGLSTKIGIFDLCIWKRSHITRYGINYTEIVKGAYDNKLIFSGRKKLLRKLTQNYPKLAEKIFSELGLTFFSESQQKKRLYSLRAIEKIKCTPSADTRYLRLSKRQKLT